MKYNIALITLMLWPAVPLFWIPVHGCPRLFRRLGLYTYFLPVVAWSPVALALFLKREFLLSGAIHFPFVLNSAGLLIVAAGALLQIWTARLLSLFGITGMAEVSSRFKSRLVVKGAFQYVRHPTYLSHTLMLAGLFLLTGYVSVGIVALLDFMLSYAIIIPLEERELIGRFGEDYRQYMKNTPKYFPRLR